MSQPVKLSDALVLDARLAGQAMERSIAGQVEFWARLGRAVKQLIEGEHVIALCRRAEARPLWECLLSVDTASGRRRARENLKRPFPHYEKYPGKSRLLVRIDSQGKRTVGRFLNRKFQPVHSRSGGKRTLRRKVAGI